MQKAAAGADAGSFRESGGTWCRGLAVAVACLAGASGWAQEAPLDLAVAGERADAAMRMEVQASALPRLDAQDKGFQAPRVDLSVLPAGGGMGVAVGMSGFAPATAGAPAGFAPQRPSLDLGLHYRHALPSSRQIDVTAYRRVNAESVALAQDEPPVYGARVELGLKPSTHKAGIPADRSFIGMQLQGGARVSIKRKYGGPMVYYRNTF